MGTGRSRKTAVPGEGAADDKGWLPKKTRICCRRAPDGGLALMFAMPVDRMVNKAVLKTLSFGSEALSSRALPSAGKHEIAGIVPAANAPIPVHVPGSALSAVDGPVH